MLRIGDVVLTQIACSQFEVEEAVSIETTRSVISPGTPPGRGQPSGSSFSTSITGSARKVPLERWKRNMLLARAAPTSLVGFGVVQPAHLERDEAGLAEVQGLLEPPLFEIPEMESLPVATRDDILDVEAGYRRSLTELRRDEDVLARLVPEVTIEAPALRPPFSQRPLTSNIFASRTAKPPVPSPFASPSMLRTTLSPGMQWTCGDGCSRSSRSAPRARSPSRCSAGADRR